MKPKKDDDSSVVKIIAKSEKFYVPRERRTGPRFTGAMKYLDFKIHH